MLLDKSVVKLLKTLSLVVYLNLILCIIKTFSKYKALNV